MTSDRGANLAFSSLLQVAREIGEPTSLDVLLGRIEHATLQALDCGRVTVFLFDEGSGELHSRLATGDREIRIPADRGIAGRTFQESQTINVPDVSDEPSFYPDVDELTGFRTRNLLSAPLVGFDSSVIGVLEFVNKRDGVFNKADEAMGLALASLTGMAIQRQLLLDDHIENQRRVFELKRAREIQRSLLPDVDPTLRGFDVSGWSEAANETGGDFYDYLSLSDGRVCIVVADVVGHGFESAILACETRALIRAIGSETDDLNEIVRRANHILSSDLGHQRFVTMFLGALDHTNGTVEYATAGCNALVYRAATDRVEDLPATMVPLAVLDDLAGSPASETTLDSGDVLAVVTDGFYEWENERDEEFGIDRVCSVIRNNRQKKAAAVIEALHEAAAGFSGSPQTDDLTAVVVKRL